MEIMDDIVPRTRLASPTPGTLRILLLPCIRNRVLLFAHICLTSLTHLTHSVSHQFLYGMLLGGHAKLQTTGIAQIERGSIHRTYGVHGDTNGDTLRNAREYQNIDSLNQFNYHIPRTIALLKDDAALG
jgi:hypothetical protein